MHSIARPKPKYNHQSDIGALTCSHESGYLIFSDHGSNEIIIRDENYPDPTSFSMRLTPNDNDSFPECMVVDPFRAHRLVVADKKNSRIQVFNISEFRQGKRIVAFGSYGNGEGEFCLPSGVAVDAETGHYFVADSGNHRIQVFDCDGPFIRQFGSRGKGAGCLNFPTGIGCLSDGTLVVSDHYNKRLQLFSRKGNFLSIIPLDDFPGQLFIGPGDYICVAGMKDVVPVFNSAGDLLHNFPIANKRGARVKTMCIQNGSRMAILFDDGMVDTVNGNFNLSHLQTIQFSVHNLKFDIKTEKILTLSCSRNGDIAMFDKRELEVVVVDAEHDILCKLGCSGREEVKLGYRVFIVFDERTDNIVVVDTGKNRILIFDKRGILICKFGSSGSEDGKLAHPESLAIGQTTGKFFVADTCNHRIQVFDSEGVFIRKIGSFGDEPGEFRFPNGIGFLSTGEMVVSDRKKGLQIFREGNFVREIPLDDYPIQICIDHNDTIYVHHEDYGVIKAISVEGVHLHSFSLPNFRRVHKFCVDPDGRVLAIDNTFKLVVTLKSSPEDTTEKVCVVCGEVISKDNEARKYCSCKDSHCLSCDAKHRTHARANRVPVLLCFICRKRE